MVVVAAAGNFGKNFDDEIQYGGITAPGNAPWVLTVGAYSHMGTADPGDDRVAGYSSRGPTAFDFAAKPDLVAPGTRIVSLNDDGSYLALRNPEDLVAGTAGGAYPYLTLSGTSMAAPMVSGVVARMLQANPALTPNAVKAILQYTATVTPAVDLLSQGAGFLNTEAAVSLARFYAAARDGDSLSSAGWSRHIIWGNYRVSGGVLAAVGFGLGQQHHLGLRRRQHHLGQRLLDARLRQHHLGFGEGQHHLGFGEGQHHLGFGEGQHHLGFGEGQHHLGFGEGQHHLGLASASDGQHHLGFDDIGQQHHLGLGVWRT